jgi:hypothetical protein
MKFSKSTGQDKDQESTLDLVKWWNDTFTKEEQKYIADRFQPMGGNPNMKFVDRLRFSSNPDAWRFLGGLMTWFRDKEHRAIYDRIHVKIVDISKHYPLNGPGYYNGRGTTTYWPDIERMKKEGLENELEELLINLVKSDKEQARKEDWGVIPGFYYELAVLYRKRKDYEKEVAILEDFAQQKHANGVMPGQLLERLEKAKLLKNKK